MTGSRQHRFRPADLLNLSFLALLSLIVAGFHSRVEHALSLLSLYGLLVAAQLLLIRIRDRNRFSRFMHDIGFPTISILTIFDSLELIVHAVNPRDTDWLLIRIDYLLFGGHPTVMIEPFTHPLLTDLLQVAYSTYYFLPVILGISLLRSPDRAAFERSLFLIMFCFYLSYVGYLLVPAIGPRYTMHHLQTGELEGFILAQPLQELLNRLEGIKRDAFPSGHTGIALTVLLLAFRYRRRLFLAFAPVVAALIAATVYCRYHYVVDVIAGIGLTAITLLAGDRFYDYWTDRDRPRR